MQSGFNITKNIKVKFALTTFNIIFSLLLIFFAFKGHNRWKGPLNSSLTKIMLHLTQSALIRAYGASHPNVGYVTALDINMLRNFSRFRYCSNLRISGSCSAYMYVTWRIHEWLTVSASDRHVEKFSSGQRLLRQISPQSVVILHRGNWTETTRILYNYLKREH